MQTERVKEYLADFQQRTLPPLVERELVLPKGSHIPTVIGPRRAGKTFFLFQQMEQLLASGMKKESILYLNGEDPRLADVTAQDIHEIVKLHWQLYPASAELLSVFWDEPQNTPGWERAARALHDEGLRLVITGSSSKLLSREIATALRGRALSYLLLPFSFREFLCLKGFSAGEPFSSRQKALLLHLLEEYLLFGGYPEVASEKDEEQKARILKEYLDLVIYRDVIERYAVRNTQLVRWLLRALLSSFAKEYSVHRLFNTLQSEGMRVSKNTLYSYLSMLEEVFFVASLRQFSHAARKKLSAGKLYAYDTGFATLLDGQRNIGRRMENAVFLELVRRQGALGRLSYWKSQLHEVDFVVSERGKASQLVQVCYQPEEAYQREVRGLLAAGKELGCRRLLVITWDDAAEKRVRWFGMAGTVRFMPLWQWLLEHPDGRHEPRSHRKGKP